MALVEKKPVEPLEITIKTTSEEFTLPESEWLIFPPFPPTPAGITLIPFSSYENPGVYIVDESCEKKETKCISTDSDDENDELVEHDSNDVPLVTLGVAHDPASKEARVKAKWEARNLKKRIIFRLAYEDCWEIGKEGSEWVEPETTTQHVYDLSTSPFERLLLATRDFLLSRHAAFQNPINKHMFEDLRSALNIRADFPGQHWPAPASTEDAPQERANEEDKDGEDYAPIPEEICILLRDPVICIRGYLALARKEAEATWVLDRALVLADIVSAFMSFLNHYNVLPDANINPAFTQALTLARGAKTALVQADKLEQTLNNIKGFNMLAWSVWARAKEMGVVIDKVALLEDADGWDVTASEGGPPQDMSVPAPLSATQGAIPLITNLIHPTSPPSLKLLHQIPFARRIIKSIQPPFTALPPKAPHFQSQLYRIVTAPAPWTPEEKWRQRRPRLIVEEDDDANAEEVVYDEPEIGPLEMVIWVERTALPDEPREMVGMGLRGAWSLVGDDAGHEFWIHRAKDFVLPNFWQSAQMTAQTARDLGAC